MKLSLCAKHILTAFLIVTTVGEGKEERKLKKKGRFKEEEEEKEAETERERERKKETETENIFVDTHQIKQHFKSTGIFKIISRWHPKNPQQEISHRGTKINYLKKNLLNRLCFTHEKEKV